MRKVTVDLGDRSYPIVVGNGILPELGAQLLAVGIGGPVAVVHDAGVPRAAEAVRQSMDASGLRPVMVEVPSGESSKCASQLFRLWEAFAAAGLDRDAAVVAVGGGMVGDLAGFAAATYLRGVRFVQVPTTLLAQVDAGVGGKTAIDIPAGKNLVGAFHQPRLVLMDLDTLQSLPEREYRSGLAEVLKYGAIADPAVFDRLEQNVEPVLRRDPGMLAEIVCSSCEIKAAVVGQDEREGGLRAILNFGHTLGHAVETVAGYGVYAHGEAVAIGMAAAGRLSEQYAGVSREERVRLETVIARYGLPIQLQKRLCTDALMRAMRQDKKGRGGQLRFVLLESIGRAVVAPVPDEAALAIVEGVQPG